MTGYHLLRDAASIVASLDSIDGADPSELDIRLSAWLDATDDDGDIPF